MMSKYILLLITLLSLINPVFGGLPMDIAWKATETVKLAPMTGKTIEFPPLKEKRDYILCLAFKGYIYAEKTSGWNNYIAVTLNGTPLGSFTETGRKRLFCRGDQFTSTHPRALTRPWWKLQGGKPALMAFWGPGTGEISPLITSARKEGYDYLLDISDKVNYLVIGADNRIENEKPNLLELSSVLQKQHKYIMHYEDIRIGYVKKEIADKARGVDTASFKEGIPAAKLQSESFTLQVMKTGGIVLENKGDKYYISSRFSYPGKERIQYCELGTASASGSSSWKPSASHGSKDITIRAVSKNIRLCRTISPHEDYIAVSDKLTNISGVDAGLEIQNIIGIKDLPIPGTFRLSGMDTSMENDCRENPTCFISQNNGAVGLVAEDNVFRSQLEILKRNNTFAFSTKNLGLAAGKSYTLKWSIYPLKNKRYFDFVNKIRNNWRVNYTVPGPCGLFDKDVIDPKIRKINIVTGLSTSPRWFEYYDGVKVNRDEYKKLFDSALSRLKQINSNIKYMPRLETNLVTIDITKIPDGEKIPARRSKNRNEGKYCLKLNNEQTAVINRTKYADSLVRDKNGNAIIDTFYISYPYINLILHPEPGNYRYSEMQEQVDYVLNGLEADGVYFDQFVPSKKVCGISFDKWDGHSVILDEKGRIKQKYYSYALTGSKARADIIKKILKKNKLAMVNGQPVTRETQSLPMLRFTEMENDHFSPRDFLDKKPPIFKWQTACQLGCPMVLGQRINYAKWYGTKDMGRMLTKSIITALRNGLLYCYYTKLPTDKVGYGPVNHMFPFTPIKLEEGVLTGKERIITCISGKYTWPHPKKPKCFYFDCRGIDKKADFKLNPKGNTWEVNVKLDDWNEIAVIEE